MVQYCLNVDIIEGKNMLVVGRTTTISFLKVYALYAVNGIKYRKDSFRQSSWITST